MYAIINDQHFGVNGDSDYFLENYAKFYSGIFFPALDESGVKTVLIPGDFWQSRKTLDAKTLTAARTQFLDPLADRGVRVVMSKGNHDVYYKNTNSVNLIDFLGGIYTNIHIIDTAEVIDDKVLMVDWICADNKDAIMSAIAQTSVPYLLGHFEINGHLMTPGHVCEHGLPKELFAKFDKVISGHFHVRGNDGKIFYTSNPSQTNWGDYTEEKGFHFFDPSTGELTPVNNPYTVYAHHTWNPNDGDEVVEALRGKIVKIAVESMATTPLDVFKPFASRIIEVAHKVTIIETQSYTASSDLTVQGEVAALSHAQVLNDYVKELAPAELLSECQDTMASLFERAQR